MMKQHIPIQFSLILLVVHHVRSQFPPMPYPFPQGAMMSAQVPIPPMPAQPMPLPIQAAMPGMPAMPFPMQQKLPVVVMPYFSKKNDNAKRRNKKKKKHHKGHSKKYSDSSDSDSSSCDDSSSDSDYRRRSHTHHSKKRRRQVLTPVVSYVTKDGQVVYQKKIKKDNAREWLDMGSRIGRLQGSDEGVDNSGESRERDSKQGRRRRDKKWKREY